MGSRRKSHFVYILQCADRSYYTGMTSDLQLRFHEHIEGMDRSSYTFGRRPVTLVWCQEFSSHDGAFRAERQIKGWSRAKKEALIRDDLEALHRIVRREWEEERRARPGDSGS